MRPFETAALSESVGRVLAAPSVSCPPAVPILVCGEEISEEAIEVFYQFRFGRDGRYVFGDEDVFRSKNFRSEAQFPEGVSQVLAYDGPGMGEHFASLYSVSSPFEEFYVVFLLGKSLPNETEVIFHKLRQFD